MISDIDSVADAKLLEEELGDLEEINLDDAKFTQKVNYTFDAEKEKEALPQEV